MLSYPNLVGNQEDWANYITNVDMRDTPFLDWVSVGDKPVNVLYNYQADKFADPRVNSHVDGLPWQNFNSAADNRGVLKALVQWFDNTTAVSKLSEDVTKIAGVESELARDIPKRLKEMGRDMENQFLGDSDGREDNQVAGYLTRSVGSWVASGAQALYPVPAAFRTPAASINATATATVVEDDIRNVFESMGGETGSAEMVTAFCGPKMRRRFSDYPLFQPSSASTGATGIVFEQQYGSRKILRNINQYEGDFFPVELVTSWWNAVVTAARAIQQGTVVQQYRTYFLHRSKWEARWNQKPQVYRPEFKGGGYEAAMDAILMLVCKSPQGEGKYAPTA